VADVLAAAEARLAEWREIERVVPSMQAYVRLEQAGPAAGVTLTPDQWAAVVAIGDGRPVEDVMDRLDEDELVVGRLVKTLVEAGLTSVGLAPAPARAAAPASTVDPAADAAPSPAVPTTATAADLVRQLATLNEATYRSQAAAPAAAEDDTHDEDDAQDGAEEGAEAPGDEPGPPPASGLADESVNRGMLLKFLSSVRS
jgi:hypothetical protein